ncbi:hypothetical protein C488_15727 [Natrinema pellirubrum DSM 15624]|uniref:DUF58 domain-containing protein n=1 Tax=Natrinema pellirubrum (strain DSM 15624 / CIP 106293 / JCM 10476 / NCIMB 786 / 157) TaxID=797303 RepID=L0JQF4_NATP1|nr:DUF58 domain-containing protein [Natrinema pellirubrum]AGB33755.1 hypothetical protein Natpe_4027 [Natrinema pellirubrum DSM 15624]ELY71986.1 hypothetical protein C488_15727 [Natrinema pellirubrum DSM 15624]
MHPTRRGWTVVALAVVLAVLAVVFARPVVLGGSVLVGAWLLTQQYRFLRDLERTTDDLSVVQSPAQTTVYTGTEVPVTLTATRETETALTLEITAGLPVGARTAKPISVTLKPGTERTDRTRTVTWPVAGRHAFDDAAVTATDGLFWETITTRATPTVTVEPSTPQMLHVGEGGDRIAASYGTHGTERSGSGIELAELREYVPGDTGKQIAWKATARYGTPYVREYEAETDRRTLLVVDHRAALGTGSRTETKLDSLREVALAIAGTARRLNDPLGLVTVGDEGITGRIGLASPAVTHGTVRRQLLDLEPTAVTEPPETTVSGRDNSPSPRRPPDSSTTRIRGRKPNAATPGDIQQSFSDLGKGDDAFARMLRPFYADQRVYRERVSEDPLFDAVRTGTTNAQGRLWTVICTDDSRPAELRETVSLARRKGDVLVLLAPTVLYEPGGLADIERAYDRYVSFEEFRRELSAFDNVTALEVGPADRLAAILEAGRSTGGRA